MAIACKRCGVELNENNTYKRTGRKTCFPVGYYRYCKDCYNVQRHKRIKQNRSSIIEKMGGKCQSCGYDKCPEALDLHHKDPSIKDHLTTKHLRHITDPERLQSELDKCVLLCANCHRETHAGLHPEFMTV